MQNIEYQPEKYWDDVATNIEMRDNLEVIAGDDDPYYVYKRKLVMNVMQRLDWNKLNILEVGPGPGGNLEWMLQHGVSHVTGADLSARMIEIASERLKKYSQVSIVKTDGSTLPFPDQSFDRAITVTVLQHITNNQILEELVKEICRTSKKEIVIFERIESQIKGHESNQGRPVDFYKKMFADNGFALLTVEYLPLQASFYACGAIRKVLQRNKHTEGKLQSGLVYAMQKAILPFTKLADRFIKSERDVAMLYFLREA